MSGSPLHHAQRDALFFSAALPKKIFNPLFNRYSGESNFYGDHVDGAVLRSKSPDQWVRSDISCTLFLAEPHEYDGGELRIHDTYGDQRVKLPAGDAVLYPGTSVHEVLPVTRGARIASFFWIESMVRSTEQRLLLWNMDMNLLQLRSRMDAADDTDPAVVGLTGTYHNLLRMWADARSETTPCGAARLPPSLTLRVGRGTQPSLRGGPCWAALAWVAPISQAVGHTTHSEQWV